ncbi:MAG: hypothetical protein DCC67_11120, partial [Planctomycetota bacterium]
MLLAINAMSAQDAVTAKEEATTIDPLEVFEPRQYEGADGLKLPYRLLKPWGYEAENRDPETKFPLVLFLHGAGE